MSNITSLATEHFVTLFDQGFLPQGLALYRSLERQGMDFRLWVLCMDQGAFQALSSLELPNIRLLALDQVETPELKHVRPGRSRGEYCWTLTPFAPRFVFESDPSVRRVTYVDADLWFRRSPEPIFEDFDRSGKAVLITDHAYAPEHDQSTTSGLYCVQFITFERDKGEAVRQWWQNRCLEWCFDRFENGKFGDQKYLDNWPECFADLVHVMPEKEWALAPWNATRFPYGHGVFWHFHDIRIGLRQKHPFIPPSAYRLPSPVRRHVYRPYVEELLDIARDIQARGLPLIAQTRYTQWTAIRLLLGRVARALTPQPWP